MVMTPLHMEHGGSSLKIIGFVISLHVLGMFAFAPLVGMAVDRTSAAGVLAAGGALLLLALLFSDWVAAARSRFRIAVAATSMASAVALSMLGFPSGSLAAALKGGELGVTPRSYAESGRVFRRFAAAAALEHPSILTADVGGLALCCDEFKIVDFAFLSNRTLAHRGPGAIGAVLAAESPDLVEAHWHWTEVGGLYDLPDFRARYAPAFADGTRLWLRRDVERRIEKRGRGCWVSQQREDLKRALQDHRYANTDVPYDRASFDRQGVVFVLDACGK